MIFYNFIRLIIPMKSFQLNENVLYINEKKKKIQTLKASFQTLNDKFPDLFIFLSEDK